MLAVQPFLTHLRRAFPRNNSSHAAIIEVWYELMQLRANTADQKVSEGWHLTQNDSGTIFSYTVRLRNRSEDYITLFHIQDSLL